MTAQERDLVNRLVLELQGQHAELRQKLATMYPVLTENDLRLCVMIKANLSTKEIASLLNITPDSVKKGKHRLRKKLNMHPDIHWIEVLEST